VTILSVADLRHHFSGLHTLRGVTFELRPGEVVGLVGPNGAGKTTLLSILAGARRPSAGRVFFQGTEVTGWRPDQAARAGVGRTFQLPRPFATMTVLDNITTAAHLRHRGSAQARNAAQTLCDGLELGAVAHQPVSGLSVASRKRLELARALATEPLVLLLDEVASGLTPTETAAAIDLIRGIAASGITILVVEHVMGVITALCSRVLVLVDGELVVDAPPDEALTDLAVVEAYLGGGEHDA
jgi:branched-chain amino acid transport system ATP-binding protein